jgi:hypothetical protein
VIATVTADGFEQLSDDAAGEYARIVVEGRMQTPDGPPAQLSLPSGSLGALPR